MPTSNYEPLDGALEALAGSDIGLKNGNSNHAPMVAEALCAMGRPQAVMPWIARYKERLLPRPAAGDPIRAETWRSALGQRDRFADWAEFFGDELRQAPWPEVLDRWTGAVGAGIFRRCDAWRHPGRPCRSEPGGQRDAIAQGASSAMPWRAGRPPTGSCLPAIA